MQTAQRAEPFYPVGAQPLLSFALPYQEAIRRFGPAHREADALDDEPGPCVYWAFRFPCGLSVFLCFHLAKDTADAYSEQPDADHILSHLPVADCLRWRLDQAEPPFYAQRYGSRPPCTCPAATGHA